jgi:hypothetical protein
MPEMTRSLERRLAGLVLALASALSLAAQSVPAPVAGASVSFPQHAARTALAASVEEAVPPARVQQARTEVDRVLATREFQQQPAPSWIERKWNQFLRWLGRVLGSGVDALTNAPSWLKSFFQALLFIVPAVLLLVWLMRQVREDRLRPAAAQDAHPAGTLAPQSEWLVLAAQFANRNEWRPAIHALYWATIAGFESRRAWQINRTRTPREYLRLLQPGTPARSALVEQTRLFELTWYGYRDATSEDYLRAAQLQSSLETR